MPDPHHPECWRDPAHHACAVREVERLRGALEIIAHPVTPADAYAAHEIARRALERVEEGGDAPEDTGSPANARPSGSPAATKAVAKPAGVRVRVTEEAVYAAEEANTAHSTFRDDLEAAAPHMEVTVDREMLEEALSVWDQQGIRTVDDFAGYLGLTITEGDTDD